MPSTFLLEAIHIAPEPGDPTTDDYEETVPDFPFPCILVHGTVSSEHKLDNGGIVNFPVTVSDYVRGSNKVSTLMCVLFLLLVYFATTAFYSWRMDKGAPRWKNVPAPNKHTQVTLFGRCFQMLPDGSLCIDLESISLPVNVPALPSLTSTAPDVTSGKRRKYPSRAPQPLTTVQGGHLAQGIPNEVELSVFSS
jgi:hypothetical protein